MAYQSLDQILAGSNKPAVTPFSLVRPGVNTMPVKAPVAAFKPAFVNPQQSSLVSPTTTPVAAPMDMNMGDVGRKYMDTSGIAENINMPGTESMWDSFKGFMGGTTDPKTGATTPGAFGQLAQGGAAIWNAWNATKAQDMAEEQYKESKRQFNMNWGAQKNTINAQMEDRQRARIDASPNSGFLPVDQYMTKYGVK
jgi:hypothetical protein